MGYGDLISAQDTARPLQIVVTALLSGLSLALTYPLSATATYLYAFSFIFVTFVAPAMLVWAQRYKKCVRSCPYRCSSCRRLTCLFSEIRGTWDPAVPKVYRRLSVSR